ncbi:chorismate mutase [Amycolatopsis cihanbeyliensis]
MCAPQPASAQPSQPLLPLTDLAAERALIANAVAAAKWGTGGPIEDPARERRILATVAERAADIGIDPATATRIFRDQLTAGKLVQRALHAYWTAHPERQPTAWPDLATEVRPALDRITGELLAQLEATGTARADRTCPHHLFRAVRTVGEARSLDPLHRTALERAVRSVCHPDDT